MFEKKKNGFTIVELLVTIAILALLFSTCVYSVNHLISKSKKKTNIVAINNIKIGANNYAKEYEKEINWDINSNTNLTESCISVQTLISKGYINKNVLDDKNLPKSIIVTKDENDVIISEHEKDIDCTTYENTVPIPTSKDICYSVTYDGNKHDLINDETLIKSSNYKEVKYQNNIYNNENHPIDAGNYKVDLHLADGRQWTDNTTGKKTVTCTINKATPCII